MDAQLHIAQDTDLAGYTVRPDPGDPAGFSVQDLYVF
jgi:hypothetical protein